jgi:hypothetical protein
MSSNIEKQLRDEIHRVLQNVDTSNAPRIHSAIKTERGYKQIEARIINMVIDDQLTPSACIPHLERQL